MSLGSTQDSQVPFGDLWLAREVLLLSSKTLRSWLQNMPPAYFGLVVKWLSRLPVTEEIAGSNPVEPAKENDSASAGSFSLGEFQLAIGTGIARRAPGREARTRAGACTEHAGVEQGEAR